MPPFPSSLPACLCAPHSGAPHPMRQRLGEATSHLPGRLEELVGEMLGEEGKHQVGALGIGFKLLPQQEPLCQELGVGELLLPCEGWRLKAGAPYRPSPVLVLAAELSVSAAASAAAPGTDSSAQTPYTPLTQAATCPSSST